MSIWQQSKEVVARNMGERRDWFQDGEYVVEIENHVYNPETQQGDIYAIVELVVVEVLRTARDPETGDVVSNQAGDRLAWFNKLNINPATGKLTTLGERGMERVKGYLVQALGGSPEGVTEEHVTPEVFARAFGAEPDQDRVKSESAQFAGIKLRARAYTTESRTGKLYTNVSWNAIPADEE
jgi:hypothetical protein